MDTGTRTEEMVPMVSRCSSALFWAALLCFTLPSLWSARLRRRGVEGSLQQATPTRCFRTRADPDSNAFSRGDLGLPDAFLAAHLTLRDCLPPRKATDQQHFVPNNNSYL